MPEILQNSSCMFFLFCYYFTASQRACKEVNLETIKNKKNNNNHKKTVSDFVWLNYHLTRYHAVALVST